MSFFSVGVNFRKILQLCVTKNFWKKRRKSIPQFLGFHRFFVNFKVDLKYFNIFSKNRGNNEDYRCKNRNKFPSLFPKGFCTTELWATAILHPSTKKRGQLIFQQTLRQIYMCKGKKISWTEIKKNMKKMKFFAILNIFVVIKNKNRMTWNISNRILFVLFFKLLNCSLLVFRLVDQLLELVDQNFLRFHPIVAKIWIVYWLDNTTGVPYIRTVFEKIRHLGCLYIRVALYTGL